MTLEDWVRRHEFLRPLARVRGKVGAAIDAGAMPAAPTPDWEAYRDDHRQGLSLLAGDRFAGLLDPAYPLVFDVVSRLASGPIDSPIDDDMRLLHAQFSSDPGETGFAVDWLVGEDGAEPPGAASFRFVGWLVLAAYLRPVVAAYAAARDEDRWLRRYCPTCGALPAMAQLVGTDPGRRRFLCCGRCGDRWRYGRTQCPFCEADSQRLSGFSIEGESGLRIDYCESCRGYLKTYDGEGSEDVLLADWTSLHLDLAARDRGLNRVATSLYDFDASAAP